MRVARLLVPAEEGRGESGGGGRRWEVMDGLVAVRRRGLLRDGKHREGAQGPPGRGGRAAGGRGGFYVGYDMECARNKTKQDRTG